MKIEFNSDAAANFDEFSSNNGFVGIGRPMNTSEIQTTNTTDVNQNTNPTVGDVPERAISGGFSNIQRTSIADRYNPLFKNS